MGLSGYQDYFQQSESSWKSVTPVNLVILPSLLIPEDFDPSCPCLHGVNMALTTTAGAAYSTCWIGVVLNRCHVTMLARKKEILWYLSYPYCVLNRQETNPSAVTPLEATV